MAGTGWVDSTSVSSVFQKPSILDEVIELDALTKNLLF